MGIVERSSSSNNICYRYLVSSEKTSILREEQFFTKMIENNFRYAFPNTFIPETVRAGYFEAVEGTSLSNQQSVDLR